MISNERTWPGRRNGESKPYLAQSKLRPPRPVVPEDTLKSTELDIERKHFVLTLKENSRGRFLRTSEVVGVRVNSIIIPATGLGEFQKRLAEMAGAADHIPPQPASAQTQQAGR